MLDMNFYKGKRILITGHTGFKGEWMWWNTREIKLGN